MWAHSEALAWKHTSGVGIYIWGVPFWYAPSFSKMFKITAYIFTVIGIFALVTTTVRAESVADGSAALKSTQEGIGMYDYRVENLRNFLIKYDSPLSAYAEDFVAYADVNGLDYRLVPSISGVESTFGKQIPGKSFNAYGWANGDYAFKSWPDSIATVSSTLKTNYIDAGAPTIAKIARRYAPPSTTWASKVKYFVGKIDALPLTFDI